MKSDLRAWIDDVGSDVERAIMALHDPWQPVDGHCPTCREQPEDNDWGFGTLDLAPVMRMAAAPCPTARLIAWNHRDEPGFRPGWAPTTEVRP